MKFWPPLILAWVPTLLANAQPTPSDLGRRGAAGLWCRLRLYSPVQYYHRSEAARTVVPHTLVGPMNMEKLGIGLAQLLPSGEEFV